jgi:hypothetical protein
MKRALLAILAAGLVAAAVIWHSRVREATPEQPLGPDAARHACCAQNLAELGRLLLRYGREQGGVFPGGGASCITAFQACAEKYADAVKAESFLCPLAGHELPTRLPNGVLRIMHAVTSYRVRGADVPLGELSDRAGALVLLFEAKSFDGKGRWVLCGDLAARWLDESEFARRAREQNLYGLPPALVK